MDEGRLDTLHLLNRSLNERFEFHTGTTEVNTDAASAFDANSGVCQDYAHVFCSVARLMGVPARYVSGHLFRRDGEEQQPAAHAWGGGLGSGPGLDRLRPGKRDLRGRCVRAGGRGAGLCGRRADGGEPQGCRG